MSSDYQAVFGPEEKAYAIGQIVNLIPLVEQQAKRFDHYNKDTA